MLAAALLLAATSSAVVTVEDAAPLHAITRISRGGGAPQLLVASLPPVSELAHDASWIYWLEPSTSNNAAGATLRRVDKSGSVVETVASILGAAPGVTVAAMEFSEIGDVWLFPQAVSESSRSDGEQLPEYTHGYRIQSYYVDRLAAPPVAVDDRGVYVRDRRAITFDAPPADCGRRRSARH